jgi:hypothetical protein
MRKVPFLVVAALLSGLFAIGVAPSEAAPAGPYCTGTYNNATFNQLIVPANASCTINNSTVNAGATVYEGASFKMCNSTVKGWLTVDRAYVNIDNSNKILGGARITPPASAVDEGIICTLVGVGAEGYSGIFCPNTLGGSLSVTNGGPSNKPFEIGECGPIASSNSITVTGNNVPVSIENVVGANTQIFCNNNNPPAVASGNQVLRVVGCAAPPQQQS